MTVAAPPRRPAPPPSADPEALIEEARARQRRRRNRTWASILVAVAAGAVAYALMRGGSNGSSVSSGEESAAGVVKTVSLSPSDLYESLAVVDGRLVLSGGPNGSLFPSASIASSSHVPASTTCHAAVVDPATLKLSDVRNGACADPALYGVRVLPINHVVNGQALASTIRISHVTATRRGYTIGPVVMRYSEASESNAEWTYGDGYLWIYQPTTSRGSELLQISATTGAVLDTVSLPVISQPLIAANDDGFWLVPSLLSGFNGSPKLTLYHVRPGARSAVVAARTTMQAHWLVVTDHSVWIDVNHYPQNPSTLFRFDGPSAQPVLHHTAGASLDYIQFGRGESEYAGDNTGLWAVVPGHGYDVSHQELVHINPHTGGQTVSASVEPKSGYRLQELQPPLVVLDGAAFVLDPPTQASSYPYHHTGFSALYRIALRS